MRPSSSTNLIVGVVALFAAASPLSVSSYVAPATLSPWTAPSSRTSSIATRPVPSSFAPGRRSVLFLSDEKKAADATPATSSDSDEKAVCGSADNPQEIVTPSTGFQIGQEQVATGTNVNLGRGGEQQDVKWVDPAMTANTSFRISWWAWAILAWPVFLFANDAFHFVPKEGLIGKFL